MVQLPFLIALGQYVFLDGLLADKAVDVDLTCLADAVTPVLCLHVIHQLTLLCLQTPAACCLVRCSIKRVNGAWASQLDKAVAACRLYTCIVLRAMRVHLHTCIQEAALSAVGVSDYHKRKVDLGSALAAKQIQCDSDLILPTVK